MIRRFTLDKFAIYTPYGVPMAFVREVEAGYVFRHLDDDTRVETFTFAQFEHLITRHDWTIIDDRLAEKAATIKLRFDDRQFAELTRAEQARALFRLGAVEWFVREEALGLANRSDISMAASIARWTPALRAAHPDVRPRKPRAKAGAPAAADGEEAARPDMAISVRTLWRYLARALPNAEIVHEGDSVSLVCDPMSLSDTYHACGKTPKPRYTDEEVQRVLAKHLDAAFSRSRPSIAYAERQIRTEIEWLNRALREANERPLPIPGYRYVRRRFLEHPAFDREAQRRGLPSAIKAMHPTGRGLEGIEVGQRIEMDGWDQHVMTFIETMQSFRRLPRKAREAIKAKRLTLVMARDRASKMFLSCVLTETPKGAAVVSALRMLCEDKSAISTAAGARNPWVETTRYRAVVTDMDQSFVGDEAMLAAARMGFNFIQPPGGKPWLRSVIENGFRWLDLDFMPAFIGRTFSNVEELDDQDPGELASTFIDQIARGLVVWITDIDAMMPRKKLGARSPRDVWNDAMAERRPVPYSTSELRNAFGADVERTLGPWGIRHENIFYHSQWLARLFERTGKCDMTIRCDAENLGAISVSHGGKLYPVPAVFQETYGGMSLATWDAVRADLSRRYRDKLRARLPDIFEARQKIEAEAAAARDLAKVTRALSPARIEHGRRDLYIGFHTHEDYARSLEGGWGDDIEFELQIGDAVNLETPTPGLQPLTPPRERGATIRSRTPPPSAT